MKGKDLMNLYSMYVHLLPHKDGSLGVEMRIG